jgi:Family of unknown function (DUF6544)
MRKLFDGARDGASDKVPREARGCASDWQRLTRPGPPAGVFTPEAVGHLPEAAARWLTAAIAPGTSLTRAAVVRMHGLIRIGEWRAFTATQAVSPSVGFIWAATARVAALPVSGFDRYCNGNGQMRWRLLGAIPVMSAVGPHVDRSAAGRLAAESVLVPTAFDQAAWTPGADADTAVATWRIDEHVERVQIRVSADGTLREISMSRWGNPDGAPYGRHPFRVLVDDQRTFAGVRVPCAIRAAWGAADRDDGEFFRAQISSVVPL